MASKMRHVIYPDDFEKVWLTKAATLQSGWKTDAGRYVSCDFQHK